MNEFLIPHLDSDVRTACRRLAAHARVLILATVLSACNDSALPMPALANVSGHLPDLAFRMTDDRGRTVTANDFRGAVVLLYFGFTRCPNECPAAMATAAAAVSGTGTSGREIRTLLVTVDPDTDTPAALHRYLASFPEAHPIGLWGDHDALLALIKRYRVAYQSAGGPRRSPLHSAAIYMFDRAGHARRMINPADSADAIVHDLRQLLAEPQR